MGGLGLNLITGPANAGKVALLLRRYLEALPKEPYLIVPNRSDVERVERDLLAVQPGLFAGSIGTFDDLFGRLAERGSDLRPVATDAQRALVVRRALAGRSLNGLGRSAKFGGFADSLLAVVSELEAGLLDPDQLDGELGGLYAAYRAELDRVGLWDRDLLRRRAAERIGGELDAWSGEPVFAYGFEDLTAAEWALLEALAGRAEVTVSIPYEPGRPVFASLRRTMDDLSALAAGRIEELPPRHGRIAEPALAHLERFLFSESRSEPPPIDGSIRFFEAAGARGTLELVGEELLALISAGATLEQIAIVCPSLERWQSPLETVLGTLGIPYSVEARTRLDTTAFGRALLSVLRFAWLGGDRADLYAFLRSPYSSLTRQNVDFLEGRLRGRAIEAPARVEEETIRLRDGQPLAVLERLRSGAPVEAVAELAGSMLRAGYGLDAPPVGDSSREDLRAYEAVVGVLEELRGWSRLDGALAPEEIAAALEHSDVRRSSAGEAGRIAVLDLMRVRTRLFENVFVLGLEEGSLPRRGHESPFLGDDARRALEERSRARLVRPDQVARDRYLFYAACTRATKRVYLVREAANDEGSPRAPSPFWDEAQALFPRDDVVRWTRRRALSELTWPLESAPSERERLRSVAARAADDRAAAEAIAAANGWERRLARALRAFERPTKLTQPQVLAELRARGTFGVTELERFADCSSIWFLERLIDPKSIDARVDARLRGSVAHQALFRFYSRLPRELGVEQLDEGRIEDGVRFLRSCLDEAIEGVRVELTDLQKRELKHGLWRDLEAFVREDVAAGAQLVPRRFEVLFGSERAAPELQRGLELAEGMRLSGKIDRIDLDPFSARGIVQDYKAGKYAHSAAQIEQEKRLQIPLYMLVLRDLVGIEPLGGLYRPLSGERKARGLLRAGARDDGLPGFTKSDYLDEEAFWGQVGRARELAVGIVDRIRGGDVEHDPKGGDCPTWCELASMCRVRRA
jgi:ATP-dependent helicase/DNAse subunit B